MQAVILAGGRGTRLAERLAGKPKPLVNVAGVPLLQRQLETLQAHNVDDVFLLVNFAADQIRRFCDEHSFSCKVHLVNDGEPRGTSGAVLSCLDHLADHFLIVYGDTLFDIDIEHMLAAHRVTKADATLLLHPNDHPADSDLVEIGPDKMIRRFHPYPHPPGAELQNLVNAAFYVIEKRALAPYRDIPQPSDFAKDLFPKMCADGARLLGYESFEYIKDLGTPKRLDKVERHLVNGVVGRASRSRLQKAVFLDRDGTLNIQKDYVRCPADLELIPGAGHSIHLFNEAEFRVVLVTNQPIIARGDCSEEDLRLIHAKLETELGHYGAYLDRIYYCPHHPDAGFAGEVSELKIVCACRKPATGLIDKATADMNLDLTRCWLVGDSSADILVAARAGVRSVLVETGERGQDGKYDATPDFTVSDIQSAADLIVRAYPKCATALSMIAQDTEPGDLVLVAGFARSGKSTLSGVLACELRAIGKKCAILALDRYILPEEQRSEGVRGRFDLAAADQAIARWLDGGGCDADVPTYIRHTRGRGRSSRISLGHDGILIIEGVPALIHPWATRRKVKRIYVEAEEGRRRGRVIGDLMRRGLSSEEGAAEVYHTRLLDECREVYEGRADADVVLSSELIWAEQQ